jgi:ferredoxin
MRKSWAIWAATLAMVWCWLLLTGCGESRQPYAGNYRSVEPFAGKGHVELELKECRIVAEGLECAICAEICPLHAIEMKTFADQEYPVPVVIQEKCNGCGKCLYRCPVKKKEEIFRFYS